MLKHWLTVLGFIASAGDPQIPYTSVQQLKLPDGVCTAFSINQEKGYWATAQHCLEDDPHGQINGWPVRVVWESEALDLAVLGGPAAPALRIGEDVPDNQTPVFKWGYGQSARPWLSTGTTTEHFVFTRQTGHLIWLYDLEILPGDSGAPVMTYDAVVVSMVEMHWPPDLQRRVPLLRRFQYPAGGLDTITLHEALAPFLPGYVAPKETAHEHATPASQD